MTTLHLHDQQRNEQLFPLITSKQLREICLRGEKAGFEKTLGPKARALFDPRGWHVAWMVEKLNDCYRCYLYLKLRGLERPLDVQLDMSEADFHALPLVCLSDLAPATSERLAGLATA